MTPMPNTSGAPVYMWCIQPIAPIAMMNAEIEPTIGHGDGLTRW